MSFSLAPLTFADRPKFEQALQETLGVQYSPLAAFSFAPHMIWKGCGHYCWASIGGWLCLFVEYVDGLYMALPPLGSPASSKEYLSPTQIVREVFDYMTASNGGSAVTRIENVPEELKDWYESHGFQLRPKDPDYVYYTRDLANLRGDRYKSQRLGMQSASSRTRASVCTVSREGPFTMPASFGSVDGAKGRESSR